MSGMDDVFIRSSDGMECVLIPAACARIGDDGKFEGGDNEGPSHEVDLESFLMDIEPVSVGAYARFLSMVHPSQEQLLDWCILPEEDCGRSFSLEDCREWISSRIQVPHCM